MPQGGDQVVLVVHRLFYTLLNLGVHGGVDAQAAGIHHVGGHQAGVAVLLHQIVHHVGDELLIVPVVDGVGLLLVHAGGEDQLLRHGGLVLLLGDDALIPHRPEHQLLALFVALPPGGHLAVLVGHAHVGVGAVDGGVVGDGDDAGALGQGQLRQILAEVVLRSRGHAAAGVAQIDVIEVPLQDLLLGVVLLKIQGGEDLLDLPLHRHVVVAGEVLDELLGDGGAALNVLAGEHENHAVEGAAPVDAVVLPEGSILDGHRGVDHVLRDVLIVHQDAVLIAVEGEMLHILPGVGILIVDDAGLIHDEVGLDVGLGDDHRLDVPGGKADQNHCGDDPDEQQGADHLAYGDGHRRRSGALPARPLPSGLRGLIGCCSQKNTSVNR